MHHPSKPLDPGLAAYSATRTVRGSIESVWNLWTTKSGLEGWWGPEDVRTTVEALEVREGGAIEITFRYGASAEDPNWRQAMEEAGISPSYRARGAFDEVVPMERLSFHQRLDFGPKSRPTDYRMSAEFAQVPSGVQITLTARSSPSAHWKTLGAANLEGQLDRMVRCLVSAGPER